MVDMALRRVFWMGSTREDIRAFPAQIRLDVGQPLYAAQQGDTDPAAKPLKGFGGASVMEIVCRHDTDTYRAVYTSRFRGRLYVLNVFQKKSTKGIATPQRDIDLIRRRLAAAKEHFEEGQR